MMVLVRNHKNQCFLTLSAWIPIDSAQEPKPVRIWYRYTLEMALLISPPITIPPHYTAASKTHIHKITNVPVFLWSLCLMILRRADPLLGLLEGVGPPWKSNFFGPWNGNERSQKSLDFQCPPLPMALLIDMPAQNHYVPCYINNRYINSYYTWVLCGVQMVAWLRA